MRCTMAEVCHPRRALVEIPAPQPKTVVNLRRSYLEVLSGRLAPSHAIPRGTIPSNTSRRRYSLDSPSGDQWTGRTGRTGEPREPKNDQQLALLIRSLVLVEQSQAPSTLTFDLKYLQKDLQLKKASVFRSIPYSRFGSNRDARCYRKAYPHLLAFKVSCEEWGQLMLRSGQWESALEYALAAWRYAEELPSWDTAGHNALRDQCFAVLAAHCLAALRHHGTAAAAADPARAGLLLRRLKMAQQHSQAIAPCVHEMERILERQGDSAVETTHGP